MDDKLAREMAAHKAAKLRAPEISEALMKQEAHHINEVIVHATAMRDAAIIRWLLYGIKPVEIAKAFNLSSARISQIKNQQLEKEL